MIEEDEKAVGISVSFLPSALMQIRDKLPPGLSRSGLIQALIASWLRGELTEFVHKPYDRQKEIK